MATFQVSSGYDMTKPYGLNDSVIALTFTNRTSTGATATDGYGNTAVITGAGFTFSASGAPTGGTVSSIDVKVGQNEAILTGASFDWAVGVYDKGYQGYIHDQADQAYWLRGNDTVIGTNTGNETLMGYEGNDTLIGGAGNDVLDGGSGIDTAVFSGTHAQYTVTKTSTGYTVIGPDGTDTLRNIERVKFSDTNVAFDTAINDNAGSVYRLYQAALNRTPDKGGEGFFLQAVDSGAKTLEGVADFMMSSPEFQSTYGSLSNANLVKQFYVNVLHREGDASGQAYWTGTLDSGTLTRARVLVEFSKSAEFDAKLLGVLDNGFEYTQYNPA